MKPYEEKYEATTCEMVQKSRTYPVNVTTYKTASRVVKKQVTSFTEHYENARFGGSVDEASRLPEIYEEIKQAR